MNNKVNNKHFYLKKLKDGTLVFKIAMKLICKTCKLLNLYSVTVYCSHRMLCILGHI